MLMKRFFLALLLVALNTGCVAVFAEDDAPALPVGAPEYGCTVVADDWGEREVCGVSYYVVEDGIVYYDPYYGVWIGPGGYWIGGHYVVGYYPGYYARYRSYYHPYGYYHGRVYGGRVYRGHEMNRGTSHGNYYRGGGRGYRR